MKAGKKAATIKKNEKAIKQKEDEIKSIEEK